MTISRDATCVYRYYFESSLVDILPIPGANKQE